MKKQKYGFNKLALTLDEERFVYLQELKNTLGIFLLVLGGIFAYTFSQTPLLSIILPPSFWVGGSYLILNLHFVTPKLTKKEKEEEKWEALLQGGFND